MARHMGHDVNIHKEYYHLQDHTLELAKVSKLLLAFDEGNTGNFAGKKLDDITLKGSVDNLHFNTTHFECTNLPAYQLYLFTRKKYRLYILCVIKAVFANLQILASWRRLFFERTYLVIYLPK